ncbi:hypothetical protein PTKIN_Ptkin17bG0034400 [Pterospermum kingtungense]
MARKWQKITEISARSNRKMFAANHSNKLSVFEKGCFVIYTMDKRHFTIPLAFLSNSIFLELLKMFEEEFGLPSDGPIRFPCDSVIMNYIVSLVKRGLAKDLERAVLNSITSHTYFNQGPPDHQEQSLLFGF